jgi:hypothetical protein
MCLVLVAFFIAVHAAGLAVTWLLLAGDLMTSVTVLLLALLKNAERRAEHVVQRKLDSMLVACPAVPGLVIERTLAGTPLSRWPGLAAGHASRLLIMEVAARVT